MSGPFGQRGVSRRAKRFEEETGGLTLRYEDVTDLDSGRLHRFEKQINHDNFKAAKRAFETFITLRAALGVKLLRGESITPEEQISYVTQKAATEGYCRRYEKLRGLYEGMDDQGEEKKAVRESFEGLPKPEALYTGVLAQQMDSARDALFFNKILSVTGFVPGILIGLTGALAMVLGFVPALISPKANGLMGFGMGLLFRAGVLDADVVMDVALRYDCGAGLRAVLPASVKTVDLTSRISVDQGQEIKPLASQTLSEQDLRAAFIEPNPSIKIGFELRDTTSSRVFWKAEAPSDDNHADCLGHLIQLGSGKEEVQRWAVYKADDGGSYFYNAQTNEARWNPPAGCPDMLAYEALSAPRPPASSVSRSHPF